MTGAKYGFLPGQRDAEVSAETASGIGLRPAPFAPWRHAAGAGPARQASPLAREPFERHRLGGGREDLAPVGAGRRPVQAEGRGHLAGQVDVVAFRQARPHDRDRCRREGSDGVDDNGWPLPPDLGRYRFDRPRDHDPAGADPRGGNPSAGRCGELGGRAEDGDLDAAGGGCGLLLSASDRYRKVTGREVKTAAWGGAQNAA